MVLCGHDHVLGKSYPIRANSTVQTDFEYVTEKIGGTDAKIMIDPAGPIHFEPVSYTHLEDASSVRMRAQVMCSGTDGCAKKKYIYEGEQDCIAASKLGGGDKLCPNGCIGLGTCAKNCPFDAISVSDGVAAVDYRKCRGCGICITACPKHIIRLIPFDSRQWVGCMSVDDGKTTRKYLSLIHI